MNPFLSYETFQVLLLILFAIAIALPIALCWPLCRQRGLSGWLSLLLAIPLLNIAFFYWLASRPPRFHTTEPAASAAGRRRLLKTISLAPLGLLVTNRSEARPSPGISNESMRRIGDRYLTLHPEERDTLLPLKRDLRTGGHETFSRLLADAARTNPHEVVVIDGYVLPRAVARICAATTLV